MKDNNKYMTDEQFNTTGTMYVFAVYANRKDTDWQRNAKEVLSWCNNYITRYEGQLLLQGLAAGASVRYKNPHAVLYAVTSDGTRKQLSSCSY